MVEVMMVVVAMMVAMVMVVVMVVMVIIVAVMVVVMMMVIVTLHTTSWFMLRSKGPGLPAAGSLSQPLHGTGFHEQTSLCCL